MEHAGQHAVALAFMRRKFDQSVGLRDIHNSILVGCLGEWRFRSASE